MTVVIMTLSDLLEHILELTQTEDSKDLTDNTMNEFAYRLSEADKSEIRAAKEILEKRDVEFPVYLNTENMIDLLEDKLNKI